MAGSRLWNGREVQQFRRGFALSKAELARKVGRAVRTVSEWENNPNRQLTRQMSIVLSHVEEIEERKLKFFSSTYSEFTNRHLVREVGRYVPNERIFMEYLAFAKLANTEPNKRDFNRYYFVTQGKTFGFARNRTDLRLENPPSAGPQIPSQGVGIRFQQSEDGQIELARGDSLSEVERGRLAGLHQLLRQAAEELLERVRSSNGYRSLERQAALYQNALNRSSDDLRDGDIELVYGAGLALQAAQETLKKEIESGDAPPEDVRLAAPLNQLLGLQGPFLQSTARGVELYEQTDRDRRTHEEDLTLKQKQAELNQRLASTQGLVTPEAQNVIELMTDAMAQGRQEHRANAAGRGAIRNLWSSITRIAASSQTHGAAAKGVLGALAGAVVLNSKVGVAAVVAGSATLDAMAGGSLQVAQLAKQFLLENALLIKAMADAGGPSFNWLSSAVDWLHETIKLRRAEESDKSSDGHRRVDWPGDDLVEEGAIHLPINFALEKGTSLEIGFPDRSTGNLTMVARGSGQDEWIARWSCAKSQYDGRHFSISFDQQAPSGLLRYRTELLPLSPKAFG